jgi:hypothetical protein
MAVRRKIVLYCVCERPARGREALTVANTLQLLCRAALAFAALASPCAARVDPDLLQQAREHVAAYLHQMPNYVCRVSIERREGPARADYLMLRDRLTLEVAFVEGRELYQAPGERAFEDKPLERLTHGGAFATGNYAAHLREIFLSDHATFTAAEMANVSGQRRVRIEFRVPIRRSLLTMSESGRREPVGYSGTLLLEPATFAPAELRVKIDQISKRSSVTQVDEVTLYRLARIGESDAILPASSESDLFTRRGQRMRNSVIFDDCRRYGSDTAIHFDAPPPAEPAPVTPVPAAPLSLPSGTTVTAELDAPLDESSAIGDPVTARIADASPLFSHAHITGAIARIERLTDPNGAHWRLFVLRFNRIVSEDRAGAFHAHLQGIETQQSTIEGSDIPRALGECAFRVRETGLPVERGLRMIWQTE